MPIHLYNSLTRKKEEFKPLKAKMIRMYNCGPTVYNYAHIGNWRSFLMADFLRRMFEFNGYTVKQVMNITDVGHLVSDADEGEDKMELAKKREIKSAWEIAEYYIKIFRAELKKLNIRLPQQMPRATDHIQEQIELVKKLEEKRLTYATSDGVYFDTQKWGRYGRLSKQKLEEKKAGLRAQVSPEKKNAADFALWKFSPKKAKRDMEWDSPWGKGFPGWHLECSAMSRKYLGQPFDVHTGGVDHIAIHHENEIAQSEAAYGTPLANYWLHGAFLLVDGGRMGKSEGNFITLRKLEEKGFNPLAFRVLALQTHYRSKLNFTWKSLQQAQTFLESYWHFGRRLKEQAIEKTIEVGLQYFRDWQSYLDRFQKRINDDLDIPQGLAVFNAFKTEVNSLLESDNSNENLQSAWEVFQKFDSVLGLLIPEVLEKNVPNEVQALVQERENLRKQEKWAEADEIRKKVEGLGYVIEDTSTGSRVRKK